MSAQFISIHPDNPQVRFVKQICQILRDGGVAVLPTDSAYALCCMLEQKSAMERIARIRQVDKHHNFTLLCRDLSEISTYAKVDNTVFRLLKNNTPGAYTFILPATKEVPRRLMNEKKKTIGIRVPDNAILSAILDELDEPLMSSTLILPERELAESDPVSINDEIGSITDLIVDGGVLTPNPTTVIVFEDSVPNIARYGAGDTTPFE
ncbi:MAG: threonylcarbamoyl-AMP synthase [Succinivibrio sp.]|uniref:tRNA threonylcarbamoyl adenosine modification protein, Sua5/YciO/YrdC/YwlC family n=1 Tax=Succinivibrio dextrinosolvens DSM 3072 TaxID=1123324 RepID=A0A1T4VMC1_9GAMM|nr:L-threonylcarbamoyladenylate synthase [Succinivibrio dextrinosolvens]MBP5244427.1 threonylcarbamoyl-AMP synthase [Succinivibrio sp.]MBQ3677924.1 threonylcarbamoyl-AMP synthase [Succinivibrio sp.]SKA66086.1 tRNA threonylcarbamoyl adenosine modification protein, Sua5/YciO/YrdC/YwlC family [Succinivibrio dextrinosolvens DSM 3072]